MSYISTLNQEALTRLYIALTKTHGSFHCSVTEIEKRVREYCIRYRCSAEKAVECIIHNSQIKNQDGCASIYVSQTESLPVKSMISGRYQQSFSNVPNSGIIGIETIRQMLLRFENEEITIIVLKGR